MPLLNSITEYQQLYKQSTQEPQTFWAEQAKHFISWNKLWHTVLQGSFSELNCEWFVGGELNAAYNCLDRHLEQRGNQPAIIWESDDPNISEILTYTQLHQRVCEFANVLKLLNIKKGDRVCIYLPMIPEAAIAMLACARIGAIHCVVFAGFSAEALAARITDAECKLVITANASLRGNKIIPLKENVDLALQTINTVSNVLVVKRIEETIVWNASRDIWYHEIIKKIDDQCAPEMMQAGDPLFILYTSGSTGKPKGILHGTGGYLVHVASSFSYVFNYQSQEIFWCTADVGWITGHSYTIYGPLLNGGTTLLFEGVPQHPTFSRFWEVIDKHAVNIFYTAPTAIRALRREGDEWVQKTQRTSLRILGTVGEPINPDAWEWYYTVVGEKNCYIVDTWWQTETGGIMLSPIPHLTPLKPGAAAWPFFGVTLEILDEDGNKVPTGIMGKLVITHPWPGMLQTVYKNSTLFKENYFTPYPGYYLTGDLAHQDADGYYWISGRSDDVLKISGHRMGTEEIESAILNHPAISESAVVNVDDPITGQAIYAFVVLKTGISASENLDQEVIATVRKSIGPIAKIKQIQWCVGLPKTRSGKIMRRLLRKIANKQVADLGDLSTLADPTIIQDLINHNKNSS